MQTGTELCITFIDFSCNGSSSHHCYIFISISWNIHSIYVAVFSLPSHDIFKWISIGDGHKQVNENPMEYFIAFSV